MDQDTNYQTGVVIPFPKRKKLKFEKVPINDKRPDKGFVPGLLRHAESGVYYVRKSKTGKPELFESLGTTAKDQAKAWAERKIAEYLGGQYVPVSKHKSNPTIEALVDEQLPVLLAARDRGDRRPETYINDVNMGRFLKKHFGHSRVSEITPQYWKNWYEQEFPKTGLKTLEDTAKHLSKVLTFAAERGYIPAKPKLTNFQKQGKRLKRKSRAYDPAEIQLISEHCTTLDQRLKLALHIECGMRSGEVRKLEWSFIQEREAGLEITLPAHFTKNKTDRSFFVSDTVAGLIREKRAKAKDETHVFSSRRLLDQPETRSAYAKQWRKIFRAAGVTGIPYWFRHTFYTANLLDAEMPVQLVSEYAGTSMATLQKHYIHGSSAKTQKVANSIREKYVTVHYLDKKDIETKGEKK